MGELSSSALSTATAVCALSVATRSSPTSVPRPPSAAGQGLAWLAAQANTDGGWGDTVLSLSNLSTTALVWAAFGAVPGADEKYHAVVKRAEDWLVQRAGGVSPERLAPAIIRRYGKDRTFSVPILTMCALAGRLGSGREAWKWVLPLPFELAACPPKWFAALRLPVVSYALPALIAIGHARHHHRPSRNPVARFVRRLVRERTLEVLTKIQPSSGGFLEATPLTSFVVMSLAGSGHADHPVTRRGVAFLLASARSDGSWPIDTNLATWVTTLAVNALCAGKLDLPGGPGPGAANRSSPAPGRAAPLQEPGDEEAGTPSLAVHGPNVLPDADRRAIRDWLLGQQYRVPHPYTHAAPGGWAWTDLPGGVPDADDTAGTLLALKNLGGVDERVRAAAAAGVGWLLDLQNRDGGIPTFCRGWGHLPFDRSSPDLTAHALQAWITWRAELPEPLRLRVRRAKAGAVSYLARCQRPDGSWMPLWFGNQHAPGETNATYGTAKVVTALSALDAREFPETMSPLERGIQWLLTAQGDAGAWSGVRAGPASIEETALAVEALAAADSAGAASRETAVPEALHRGTRWLIGQVESGAWKHPAPIGFYFAKLWYFERLYPVIFTVAALEKSAARSNTTFRRRIL